MTTPLFENNRLLMTSRDPIVLEPAPILLLTYKPTFEMFILFEIPFKSTAKMEGEKLIQTTTLIDGSEVTVIREVVFGQLIEV